MTDRLLTDDDLAAIAARFEELINLGISGHTDTWKRQKLLAMEMSENDVPRLLAHIRAQAAENARLRDALGEILDSPIARNSWDGSCAICGEWHGYGSDKDADCPLGRAQGALKHATNT